MHKPPTLTAEDICYLHALVGEKKSHFENLARDDKSPEVFANVLGKCDVLQEKLRLISLYKEEEIIRELIKNF